jgi:3,4-dihydroxy 2-butanone 4-phosphate synthase/GTP cyclohydrolase II
MKFASIEEAINDIREGKIVVVVDDEDRENEGDFIMAAEFCSAADVNLMRRLGSGYVCVPMSEERLLALHIPMQADDNTSKMGTQMAVSVEAKTGTTTGVSAEERSITARTLANPATTADDIAMPGHIVPLRASEGGVLKRAGHTEAAVDLCKLAGLQPVGLLAEVMNPDGSMARLPQLQKVAAKLGLNIITIADLIKYRRRTERLIERVATTELPTERYGTWTVHAYRSAIDPNPAIALVKGDVSDGEPTLIRVHSSCVTGDLLDSLRCDCGDQLHMALDRISEAGRGVLIYLEQEGRGIGIVNKIRAYALQDTGDDTVQANQKLGFKADLRDYGIGAQIMVDLGLSKLLFMTNNPSKVKGIEGYALEIVDWVPLIVKPNPHNRRYLETKRDKLGHLFPPPSDQADAAEAGSKSEEA